MYKPYSDSYLMTKSKKTLIGYLRVAEHNHKVCEEAIDQQAKNCVELLKKERVDTIEKIKKYVYRNIHFYDAIEQEGFYKFLDQLKRNEE